MPCWTKFQHQKMNERELCWLLVLYIFSYHNWLIKNSNVNFISQLITIRKLLKTYESDADKIFNLLWLTIEIIGRLTDTAAEILNLSFCQLQLKINTKHFNRSHAPIAQRRRKSINNFQSERREMFPLAAMIYHTKNAGWLRRRFFLLQIVLLIRNDWQWRIMIFLNRSWFDSPSPARENFLLCSFFFIGTWSE